MELNIIAPEVMCKLSLTRHSSGTRPEAGEPLNSTLGAMRIMPIFFILGSVDRAVVFVASLVLVASGFVVELLVQHVQVFSRAVVFSVSRSSLLRSLWFNASPFFRAVVFRRFIYSTP